MVTSFGMGSGVDAPGSTMPLKIENKVLFYSESITNLWVGERSEIGFLHRRPENQFCIRAVSAPQECSRFRDSRRVEDFLDGFAAGGKNF